MNAEKELFLEEIKQSQEEILQFKEEIRSMAEHKEQIERDNQELTQLLRGEKSRSDKLDREIMELLNHNQELKLVIAEMEEQRE